MHSYEHYDRTTGISVYTAPSVKPGQTFAEAALFASGTYPATAEALVESRVWCLPRDRLLGLIGDSPQIGLALVALVQLVLGPLSQILTDPMRALSGLGALMTLLLWVGTLPFVYSPAAEDATPAEAESRSSTV